MSQTPNPLSAYHKIYIEPNFERSGLFEFLSENFQIKEVLYPGCGVHITPAFFFPHLVFVDQSTESVDFFSNKKEITEEIQRHKTYRRSAYIEFIAQDYTEKLSVRENQFDLLLSLFAGEIAENCTPYLKPGGLLLTNNHHGDAVDASKNRELIFAGIVQQKGKKYKLAEGKQEIKSLMGRRRYVRQTSSGFEYIEKEIYYLFQKETSSQKG